MPEEKNGIIKKVVAGVLICFSLLAGYYAIWKFFTPREVFDMSCEAAEKRFKVTDQKIEQEQKEGQLRILEQQQLYLEAREINQMQFIELETDEMRKLKKQKLLEKIQKDKEKNDERIYKLKNP